MLYSKNCLHVMVDRSNFSAFACAGTSSSGGGQRDQQAFHVGCPHVMARLRRLSAASSWPTSAGKINLAAIPVRPDRAGDAVERAGRQARRPAAAPDRPGPASSTWPLGIALEAGLAVIRLVADQHHQPVALGLAPRRARARSAPGRCRGRGTAARPSADRAAAPWPRRSAIGDSRTEPTSSVPMRAVNDSSSRWRDLLADAIGGLGDSGPARTCARSGARSPARRPASPAGW